MRVRRTFVLTVLTSLSMVVLGCMTPKGGSVDERRSYVRKMRTDMLREVYANQPGFEKRIRESAGYAVFSNLSVKVFVLGPGQGYGMLVENPSGKETFMRMGQLGAGVGLGARTTRVLILFKDPATLATFRDKGWEFGGTADVAAKAGDVGAAAGATGKGGAHGGSVGGTGGAGASSGGVATGPSIEVYEFTQTGLALAASVTGTRYWKDKGLN